MSLLNFVLRIQSTLKKIFVLAHMPGRKWVSRDRFHKSVFTFRKTEAIQVAEAIQDYMRLTPP